MQRSVAAKEAQRRTIAQRVGSLRQSCTADARCSVRQDRLVRNKILTKSRSDSHVSQANSKIAQAPHSCEIKGRSRQIHELLTECLRPAPASDSLGKIQALDHRVAPVRRGGESAPGEIIQQQLRTRRNLV